MLWLFASHLYLYALAKTAWHHPYPSTPHQTRSYILSVSPVSKYTYSTPCSLRLIDPACPIILIPPRPAHSQTPYQQHDHSSPHHSLYGEPYRCLARRTRLYRLYLCLLARTCKSRYLLEPHPVAELNIPAYTQLKQQTGKARVTAVARSNYKLYTDSGVTLNTTQFGPIKGWKPYRGTLLCRT